MRLRQPHSYASIGNCITVVIVRIAQHPLVRLPIHTLLQQKLNKGLTPPPRVVHCLYSVLLQLS